MRVMRVIAGNVPLVRVKVSKTNNIYRLKHAPQSPASPAMKCQRKSRAGPSWHMPFKGNAKPDLSHIRGLQTELTLMFTR